MKRIIASIWIVFGLTNNASAQDTTNSGLMSNIGVVEVASLPSSQHIGFYLYAGISKQINTNNITFIPSLSLELSPEIKCWGLVASITADVQVSDLLGIDAQIMLVHDQPAWHFDQATFSAGPGIGFSLYLGSITISPNLSALYGLNSSGWVLVPACNISF